MLGETEQHARFTRALQEAMDARSMSARQLALKLKIDARRIAAWLKGRGLPNLYEAAALADALSRKGFVELVPECHEAQGGPLGRLGNVLLADEAGHG